MRLVPLNPSSNIDKGILYYSAKYNSMKNFLNV